MSKNSNSYDRLYQSNCRGIVCNTVRGSIEDAELLNKWKAAHPEVTWLQLLYRGAGIKRPKNMKANNIKPREGK